MNISRKKFIILFIISSFIFLFVTTSLLGTTGVRGFPQAPDSVLRTGADSPVAWKSIVSNIILPIKVVLVGPLIPYFEFLRQEPDTPPPFFAIGLLLYWTILSMFIHYLIGRIKNKSQL